MSKHKDAATRYKAAYERVRLQRDFYEGATSSLLHQVRMLGGDPMQASKRASKGENLDPKKARVSNPIVLDEGTAHIDIPIARDRLSTTSPRKFAREVDRDSDRGAQTQSLRPASKCSRIHF